MNYLVVKNNKRGVYHKIKGNKNLGYTVCGLPYAIMKGDRVLKSRPKGLRICGHCAKL